MQKMKNETPFLKKKNSREKVIVFLICALGVAVGQAVPGEDKDNPFAWYGDLRLRYEADFDSEKIDRSEVDDRNRGRIRARVGANYQVNPDVKIGARLRTGDSRSQQSPHLTFVNDQNVDNDDLDFVLDKLFVGYNREVCQAWVGRNSFPFWKQNELFWDDEDSGFFFTSDDHETLIARAKKQTDSVLPSGNGVTALNLIYLAEHVPESDYDAYAEKLVGVLAHALQNPQAARRMPTAARAVAAWLAFSGADGTNKEN